MRALTLEIGGMKNRGSASEIQKILNQTEGLKGKVSYTDSRVHLMLTDESALDRFIAGVQHLGYSLSEIERSAEDDDAPLLRWDKTMAIRTIPFLLLLIIIKPHPLLLIPVVFIGLYLIKHWSDK